MRRFLLVCALLLGSAAHPRAQVAEEAVTFGPNDWPWWRGPHRNGVADARQKPPTRWNETDGILWKAPIPGRGHGSPIVVGDQVFLATAEHDQQSQSVLCFDRNTGKRLWQTVVHQGKFEKGGNGKASLASATAACDGRRVFINFLHDQAIYTTALSMDGKKLWQTRVTGFQLHQGYGPSPTVYKSLVLVTADNKGTGLVAGLDRATGGIVWKQERPKWPNYASPIIIKTAGRDELILTGCERIASYDPLTGKPHWDFKGTTQETVTSIVTDGEHIFTSGGYPKKYVSAIKADGSGQTAWEIKTQVYVPSMLVHDKHLYAVTDGGVAVCWECATAQRPGRNASTAHSPRRRCLSATRFTRPTKTATRTSSRRLPGDTKRLPRTNSAPKHWPRRRSAAVASTCVSPPTRPANGRSCCTASGSDVGFPRRTYHRGGRENAAKRFGSCALRFDTPKHRPFRASPM